MATCHVVKLKRNAIEIARRHNGNPDNGPVGFRGWTATLRFPAPRVIVGCPLGRTWSEDPEEAVRDLIRQIWAESKVDLILVDDT